MHFYFSNIFTENRGVYGIMWEKFGGQIGHRWQ